MSAELEIFSLGFYCLREAAVVGIVRDQSLELHTQVLLYYSHILQLHSGDLHSTTGTLLPPTSCTSAQLAQPLKGCECSANIF